MWRAEKCIRTSRATSRLARAEPEAEDSGSEEESDEDACPLTDSQLKNIYDNGTPLMRSLLSVNDHRRLELILSGQADDKSDDRSSCMTYVSLTPWLGIVGLQATKFHT